ncbi:uncharacterized protein LOC129719741 [Wyeomyia smithii]|uniref:uncharacterized protein LOC129719741 n=1 Tax=Wyeomyia smithii TaxID=174621 RepID=UPI00246808DB|nr:uncharacterized protein LOC129719741 [Wyeomyia smithii]
MSNSSAGFSSRRKRGNVHTQVWRKGVVESVGYLQLSRKTEKHLRLMYRTVSYETICVLAHMMPISIIVKEDVECFDQGGSENGPTPPKADGRTDSSLRKPDGSRGATGKLTST